MNILKIYIDDYNHYVKNTSLSYIYNILAVNFYCIDFNY